jgi:putative ABC transport system ATP-binding protein
VALIEISQVVKEFQMGDERLRALNGVSLSIQEGEFSAIVGPSGCGKSTLMNILGLLDNPTSGIYRIDGVSAEKLDDDARARMRNQKIGFVFQSFNLLPRVSALRNVEMPLVYSATYDRTFSRGKIREAAEEALSRVGLSARALHKPNELSGGERQRVAIARALVNKPRLLLADEPTGNLDSKAGAGIMALFEELNRAGMTLIMVTHDPKIADRAGHVISMLDGKVRSDTRASH